MSIILVNVFGGKCDVMFLGELNDALREGIIELLIIVIYLFLSIKDNCKSTVSNHHQAINYPSMS